MDSEGNQWPPEKHYVKAQEKLAASQRIVSRRVKGSNRRRKAVRLLAKKSLHVQCQRKEWHRCVAKELCLASGIIVHEQLDIKPMVKRTGADPRRSRRRVSAERSRAKGRTEPSRP